MEYKIRCHTVGVDASETCRLPFADFYYAQDKRQKKESHGQGTYEAFFFAYGAEYEVGVLLRHIFQFCLCAVEEALAEETSGAYGYF